MSGPSKAGPTTTTTNNATLPQHITDAQKQLMSLSQMLTGGFTGQQPNYSVMGLTPDQLLAGDLTRQTAQDVFTRKSIPAYDVFGMGAAAQGGGQATAAQANAAQLAPGEINPFMNPFIDAALDPTMDRLKQQQQEVQSRIGADAAAAHSFGGSREAVSRMLADRNYRDTAAQTAGNMLMAGFDKASGLASANTDREQQANLANAAMQQQTGMNNANLTYQGQESAANRFLEGLRLQGGLDSQDLANRTNIINQLGQFGGLQRQVGQQSIDAPFTALQRLLQTTPMAVPQSTTETQTKSQPMDLLSALLAGGKLAAGFV